ncbi:MAG TPA: CocE/NonD family hydrolase [Streptosporangiaceae bacterium]
MRAGHTGWGGQAMSLANRAYEALIKVPPALTRDVTVERDVVVRAPDGTALLTDLYLARPRQPLPTILIRSPYGRSGPYGVIARVFAERGYHAVVQSTRGTFGSGGQIDADREAGDGRAAADWVVDQDWSNGEIGGFGGSYLSFTQLALASTRPPQLKALAIAVWGAERRAGYYPGGSFALERALGWAYTIGSQERGGGHRQWSAAIRAALRAQRALAPAFAHLPLLDADVVAVGHPARYYRAVLEHAQPGDPYWAPTNFQPLLRDLGIPVTMLAGWYDAFLPYMLADYQVLREGGQTVRLRVGAWHHTSQDVFRYSVRDALEWFGIHLRHQQAPAPGPASVEVMGSGWRDLPRWPPPARIQAWHLQPGRALAMAPPPDGLPDRFRYDPADPTPAVGGPGPGRNSGPRDNRALERRADVLTYTSATLAAGLEIMGPVSAELHVASTRAHTDFFARLCEVSPQGRSVNVTDGLLRLTEGGPRRIRIDLWPTAYRFRPGSRIRLQVSSGAHPRYARNPGTGEPLATATSLTAAEQAVYHDPGRPSAVLLPVTGAG